MTHMSCSIFCITELNEVFFPSCKQPEIVGRNPIKDNFVVAF